MINTRLLRSLVFAFALCPLDVSALSPIFPNVLQEKLLELDFDYVDTYLNEAPDESSSRHRDVLGELALLTSETWDGEISDPVVAKLIELRDAMLGGDALAELVEEDYVGLVRIALQAENAFVLQFLLDRYSSVASTPPTEGLADPFHEALAEHIRFIPTFVGAGVDLNRQLKQGWPLALLLKYAMQRPHHSFSPGEYEAYVDIYGTAEERAAMFWQMVDMGADARLAIANTEGMFADAVLVGDVRILDYLLARGAAIEAPSTYGAETALIVAAYKGHNYGDSIPWLLAHGADICAEGDSGATAYDAALAAREVALVRRFPELLCSSKVNVAWAGFSGDTDIIEYLLANGGDVNDATSNGTTALMAAAGYGDNPEQTLSLLLAHGADPCLESEASYGGFTAADLALQQSRPELLLNVPGLLCRESMKFHLSGIAGNVDVMAYLLEQGADINGVDEGGLSALLHAVSSPNALEAVPWLLRNGADACLRVSRRRNGPTAFEEVLMRARPNSGLYLDEASLDAVRTLLRNPDLLCPSETRLYEAIPLGDIDQLVFMLQRGVSIDAAELSYGWTPLIRAVISPEHRLTLIPFLVERGADRCARDKDGNTAYDHAARSFRSDEELALLPLLRCEDD